MATTLANEYRPKTLDQILSHERYINAIKKLIRNNQLPNCILVAGNSGVGKTTLSRVIASIAMCKNLNKDTLEPCMECNDCTSVHSTTGGPNFIHLDGSESDIRKRVDEVIEPFLKAAPVAGARARVCIADEAQALTVTARNSLLTLTENLPARSIFIMTTTDPEAIDNAMRTRSFKLFLGSVSVEAMMAGVLIKEPNLPKGALRVLAQASRGSMREMWQLVHQLKAMDEEPSVELAEWIIGGAIETDRLKLWKAIKVSKPDIVLSVLDSLIESGVNLDRLGDQLIRDAVQLSKDDVEYWSQVIRVIAKAQIIGKESIWRSSLCSLVGLKTQSEHWYQELFK